MILNKFKFLNYTFYQCIKNTICFFPSFLILNVYTHYYNNIDHIMYLYNYCVTEWSFISPSLGGATFSPKIHVQRDQFKRTCRSEPDGSHHRQHNITFKTHNSST